MKHTVTVKMPEREIGKADVEFEVKQDGKTLGALHIPKGSVVWFPSGYTTTIGWMGQNSPN